MGEDDNRGLDIDTLGKLNPYKSFKIVSERKIEQWLIQVTTDDVDIKNDQADRLIENTHKALQIAFKMNKGPINGYKGKIPLRFPKKGTEGLLNDLVAREDLLKEDDDSQTAAFLHELVHAIEEDVPGLPKYKSLETVPLAVEFMFGGESRLPHFVNLTDKVIKNKQKSAGLDADSLGWKISLQILQEITDVDIDLITESAEEIVEKLEKARKLEEPEKITCIQKYIKQDKVSP